MDSSIRIPIRFVNACCKLIRINDFHININSDSGRLCKFISIKIAYMRICVDNIDSVHDKVCCFLCVPQIALGCHLQSLTFKQSQNSHDYVGSNGVHMQSCVCVFNMHLNDTV